MDSAGIIDDYYQMVVSLIKKILYDNPNLYINISLMNNNYIFNNNNKTIYININWEHTIVKDGGRSVPHGCPHGKLLDDTANYYLVRIDRFKDLNNSDIVIDYSIPNIENVKISNLFNDFSKKHVYIASSLYECEFAKEHRNIPVLTTFINTNEPRRKLLLDNLAAKNIGHINFNNCFGRDSLRKLYLNTKILINVHQTPHHHTFEELRVLPALQCGVIVVCEKSPLSNLIPYNDYIIWEDFDNISDKVCDVINNYDYYYNKIFVDKKPFDLNSFEISNYDNLSKLIINHVPNNRIKNINILKFLKNTTFYR